MLHRSASVAMLLTVGLLLTGCAAEQRQRELEFELRKVTEQRDDLAARLAQSDARGTELTRQLAHAEDTLNTARAEVGSLSSRIRDLERDKEDLAVLVQQQAVAELARPAVPTSTLPPVIDNALAAFVQRFSGRVAYDPGRGAVSFANDRLFDAGSAEVRSDAGAPLTELAGLLALRELEGYEAIVVGHTDNSPITRPETLAKHPTNWHLSVHRAIAVKDLLVNAGAPASRVGVMGYADQRPVSSDPAQNRRIEVFVIPQGGLRPFEAVRPR